MELSVQADQLLPEELSDVDGNTENRRGMVVSAFDGPRPDIRVFDTEEHEIEAAAEWLKGRIKDKLHPHEIGIFVCSEAQFDRASAVVQSAGMKAVELHEAHEMHEGKVAIMTMHLAKGLEY